MNQISNPFSQMLVSCVPHRFFGRNSDIEPILQGASSREPRSFAIHGIKTIGKTSMLKYLCDSHGAVSKYQFILGEHRPGHTNGLEFIYRDYYYVDRPDDILSTLYETLLESEQICSIVSSSSTAKTNIEANRSKQEEKKALKNIFQTLQRENIRLVICLDHFDKSFECMKYEDDIFLRNLANDQSFIIATENSLTELRKDFRRTSPLLNILMQRSIGLLTETEARELIEVPAREAKTPFTEPEIEFLIETAGRQPYLLTIASEFLFDLRSQQSEVKTLLSGDERVRQQVRLKLETLPAVTEIFDLFWKQLPEHEQNTLFKIAIEKTVDQEEEQLTLRRLSQKILVHESLREGKYHVFSRLFRNYIQRQHSSRQKDNIDSIINNLAPLDKKLFEYLQSRPNQVCTFEDLFREVWGEPSTSKRGLEAAVHRLRTQIQKTDETGWEYIRNVRGKGYQYLPKPN